MWLWLSFLIWETTSYVRSLLDSSGLHRAEPNVYYNDGVIHVICHLWWVDVPDLHLFWSYNGGSVPSSAK